MLQIQDENDVVHHIGSLPGNASFRAVSLPSPGTVPVSRFEPLRAQTPHNNQPSEAATEEEEERFVPPLLRPLHGSVNVVFA